MSKSLNVVMPLAKLLGLSLVRADQHSVEASMIVTPEICTTGEVMHGGALMAMADCLGATAAFINLPAGAVGTTTVESKTNFLCAAPVGATVTGRTEPIRIGRRLSVWSTTLTDGEGRKLAMTTQSQLVLTGPTRHEGGSP